MPNANAVDVALDDLYLGEDQALYLAVDATEDDSGIPVEDWEVEARFSNKRVMRENAIVNPAHMVDMPYILDDEEFQGVLLTTDSSTKLKAGPVSMQFWRTNSGAVKMLLHVNFTAYATIGPAPGP